MLTGAAVPCGAAAAALRSFSKSHVVTFVFTFTKYFRLVLGSVRSVHSPDASASATDLYGGELADTAATPGDVVATAGVAPDDADEVGAAAEPDAFVCAVFGATAVVPPLLSSLSKSHVVCFVVLT